MRQWRRARQAYALYGLGEAIIEGSVYSESTPQQLRAEFGEDYLDKLAQS